MVKVSDEAMKKKTESAPSTVQPVARIEASSPAVIVMRRSPAGDPIRSVNYEPGTGTLATSDTDSYSYGEGVAFPADRGQPVTTFTIPPPSRSKAAYPDHIVLIKSENHTEAAEQVRNLVQSLNGKFLAYGSDVTFCQVPFELQDQFLIALDSLGKVTVISGPIERTDAHYFLVEVITIATNP
jgi:hypothetical protein